MINLKDAWNKHYSTEVERLFEGKLNQGQDQLAALNKINTLVPFNGLVFSDIKTDIPEIVLNVDVEDFAKVATQEDVDELYRYGVEFDDIEGYLYFSG